MGRSVRNKLVTSFQYGYWTYDRNYGASRRGNSTSLDQVTLQNRGPMDDDRAASTNPRITTKASATSFSPDLFWEATIQGLVRLCGQMVRPPVSAARFDLTPQGRL